MKNLKIALILLAVVAIFSSCKKDEDETTATANGLKLTVTSSIGNELSTANMDEVLPTDFTVTVNASEETNGLKSITGAVYGIWKGDVDPEHQEGDLEPIYTTDDFATLFLSEFKKKDKTFSAEIPFSFTKANVETYASWCKAIRVTVTAVSNAKEPETLTRECNITLTVAEPEPETTALPTEWSDVIYLARPSMTGYAVVNGVRVDQSENTTIGVAITNTNTGSETKIETTANCEGFVVVANDEFDSVEALAEAYAAGRVETSLMLPFNYHEKAYAEKNFISKIGDDYVLVKYTSGDVYPDGDTQNNGNVYGFKYKKAETTPAAK